MPKKPKFETLKPWLPLRTQRLVLRPFREDDLEDIHAYGSDPEVTRFMVWGPNTPEDSRAFLDRMLAQQAVWPRPNVSAAVELRGRVIGAVELRVKDPGNLTGEFGYAFGRPYWGQGYGPEAAGALLRQGFEAMGLHRITADCDVRNERSWRAMEKLGMRREAPFRQNVKLRRGWRDSHLYAILASEWRGRHAAPLHPSARAP